MPLSPHHTPAYLPCCDKYLDPTDENFRRTNQSAIRSISQNHSRSEAENARRFRRMRVSLHNKPRWLLSLLQRISYSVKINHFKSKKPWSCLPAQLFSPHRRVAPWCDRASLCSSFPHLVGSRLGATEPPCDPPLPLAQINFQPLIGKHYIGECA